MAHVAKYTRAAVGHLFAHYERAKDDNGQYIRFANQSIDPEKTPENYNLGPEREIDQGDFMRQRFAAEDVHVNSRKDLNVMCSWVVTLPQGIDRTDGREFMERAYDFAADRYGRENVVSAYVHMDEVQPHMHFAFVPVVADQKHGGYKVSAKDAVNRYDLQTFHIDLDRHMERLYGRNIGILNEATREGNRSIEELKRGDAVRQVAELRQQATEATQTLSSVTERLQEVVKEQNVSESVLERLRRDTEQAQQGLREVQKSAARMTDTADKYAKQKMAAADREADQAVKNAQRDAAALRSQADEEARQTITQAKGEVETIRTEIPALIEQRDAVAQELAALRAETKFMDMEPDKVVRHMLTKKPLKYELSPEQYQRYISLRVQYNDQSRELYMAKNQIGYEDRLRRENENLLKENRQLRRDRDELTVENKRLNGEVEKANTFFEQNPDVQPRLRNYLDRVELEAEKTQQTVEQSMEKGREPIQDLGISR